MEYKFIKTGLAGKGFEKVTHYGCIEGYLIDNEEFNNTYGFKGDTDAVLLSYIWVDDSYRKQGLAKELMIDFIKYCKKNHAGKPIVLLAESLCREGIRSNDLIKFYGSVGFRSNPRKTQYMIYEV